MTARLKTGILSRGAKLAKLGFRVGSSIYQNKLSTYLDIKNLKSDNSITQIAAMLQIDAKNLRGAVLKLGQQLSVFGEYFFSPEVNELLKSLQSNAEPVEWAVIHKQLCKELGNDYAKRITIENEPIACASIGQVYRATDLQGHNLCLKIQYPGIHRTVTSDLTILRILLRFSNLLPVDVPVEAVMKEVKSMLLQEVNYQQEQQFTRFFAENLNDQTFLVPDIYSDLSTKRILTMSFAEGVRFDDPQVQALPQKERDGIGRSLLDLMFREIFEFRLVQTDPHLGNFLYQKDLKKIVLLDFGACRSFSIGFVNKYKNLVTSTLNEDREGFDQACLRLRLYDEKRSASLVDDLFAICKLANIPFNGQVFDFNHDDLPQQALSQLMKFSLRHKLTAPPREFIFLNRKIAGTYALLKVLKAKFSAIPIVEQHVHMKGRELNS